MWSAALRDPAVATAIGIAQTRGPVRRSNSIELVQMALLLLSVAASGLFVFGLAWGWGSENFGSDGDPHWVLAWIGGCLAAAIGLAAWWLGRRAR